MSQSESSDEEPDFLWLQQGRGGQRRSKGGDRRQQQGKRKKNKSLFRVSSEPQKSKL